MTFIYALCEPGTRTVRYIGKANDPERRLKRHLSSSSKRQNHLGCWLRSIGDAAPNLMILREVPSDTWQEEEARYIRAARALGLNLVNATDGGDGRNGGIPSPETRLKLRTAKLGKKLSSVHRTNMSAALTGRKLSPSHVAKTSAGHRGKQRSLAACANMRTAKLGSRHSQTTRSKMCMAQQARRKAEKSEV